MKILWGAIQRMANAVSDLFFFFFFFFFFAFFPNKTIWLALHHLCLPYSSPFPCLASNTHTLTRRYTTHSRSCKSILSHLPTLTHWHTHTPKFTHTHTPKFTYAVVFTSIEIQKKYSFFFWFSHPLFKDWYSQDTWVSLEEDTVLFFGNVLQNYHRYDNFIITFFPWE